IRGPRVEPELDAVAALLPDEPAIERDRWTRGVHVVDAVARTLVRDPGSLDGVGVDVTVRVAEAEAQDRLAHRPGDRLVDVGSGGGHRLGPVEARGFVVV